MLHMNSDIVRSDDINFGLYVFVDEGPELLIPPKNNVLKYSKETWDAFGGRVECANLGFCRVFDRGRLSFYRNDEMQYYRGTG